MICKSFPFSLRFYTGSKFPLGRNHDLAGYGGHAAFVLGELGDDQIDGGGG